MQEIHKGDVVVATMGRETGEFFVVLEEDKGYLMLVNGTNRKLENPKKKNAKHVMLVEKESAKEMLKNRHLLNAEIKKFIKNFQMGALCQRKM